MEKASKKLFVLMIMLSSLFLLNAMNPPGIIYVKTSEGDILAIHEDMIKEMKTLLVLLEQQQEKNSYDSPINASMVTKQELIITRDAFSAFKNNRLETFIEDMFKTEKNPKIVPLLINAAEKLQTSSINNALRSYFLSYDFQQETKGEVVKNIMPFLTQEMRTKNPRWFLGSNFESKPFFCCKDTQLANLEVNRLEIRGINGGLNRAMRLSELGIDNGRLCCFNTIGDKGLISSYNATTNISKIYMLNLSNLDDIVMDHFDIHPTISLENGIFDQDGKRILCWDNRNSNNLVLCDVYQRKMIYNLNSHSAAVNGAEFNSTEDKIISYGDGAHDNLILWNCVTGKKIHSLVGHLQSVREAHFNTTSDYIISRDRGNTVKLWNTLTGTLIHTIQEPIIQSLQFNKKGDKIYINRQHDIKVLDISDPKNIGERIFPFRYSFAAINLTNDNIITGDVNNLCTSWNASNFKNITGTKFDYKINNAQFSPDGNTLVLMTNHNYHPLFPFVFEISASCVILNAHNFNDVINSFPVGGNLGWNQIWSTDNTQLYLHNNDENDALVKIDFSAQEKKNISEIITKMSFEKIRVMEQLLKEKNRGKKELFFKNKDIEIFKSLPPEIKKYLPTILCPRIPTEKELGGESKKGNECVIF